MESTATQEKAVPGDSFTQSLETQSPSVPMKGTAAIELSTRCPSEVTLKLKEQEFKQYGLSKWPELATHHYRVSLLRLFGYVWVFFTKIQQFCILIRKGINK